MTIKPILLTCTLLAGTNALAAQNTECPVELVNYWKNFATKMDNPDAVPRFLLENNCFRAVGTTQFPVLASERLDNPGQQELVDKLYAQLTWTSGHN